jgi:hypothetical protein
VRDRAHPARCAADACAAEHTARMGASYLKRLFFLHLGRAAAFKRLLTTGPGPHPPTPTCGLAAQQGTTRAWVLAAALLSWDARPDVSSAEINETFTAVEGELACTSCRDVLRERVRSLTIEWALVKVRSWVRVLIWMR